MSNVAIFCAYIIKGPPNDIYCIIEEPYKHYFTEKVSYSTVYACSVTAADSRLASNAVVSSLFDGASTHRTIYP